YEFSINGAASNGNVVTVNLDAGNATAAAAGASADSDQHGNTITFSLDGGAVQTVTLAGGDTTAIAAAARINGTAGAAAIVTASVASNGTLQIVANQKGAHSLAIAGTNTYAGLNGTYKGTSRTGADLVASLNAGINADPELSKAGLQATISGGNVLTV